MQKGEDTRDSVLSSRGVWWDKQDKPWVQSRGLGKHGTEVWRVKEEERKFSFSLEGK